ncbi:MAG: hypothetical protein IJT09_06300, partial [Abditibacteriota bacterium]|nr:hypothetical protein [Abditibacteriota bacterium]
LADIKKAATGREVIITGELTASSATAESGIAAAGTAVSSQAGGTFYASQPNRLGSVRCVTTENVARGEILTFNGVVRSDKNGKYVQITKITSRRNGEQVRPLAGAASLKNNALVRLWGKVTAVGEDNFTISYAGKTHTVVASPANIAVGDFVIVTGIADDSGKIITRNQSDVVKNN